MILGWYLGGRGENCNVVCSRNGLVCTEQDQFQHNSEVDACDELIDLIDDMNHADNYDVPISDYDLEFKECNLDYGSSPDVPSCSDDFDDPCYASSSSRNITSFDCAAEPLPLSDNKRRLCYCNIEL